MGQQATGCCEDAPIICSLQELNGYTSVLPATLSTDCPQPENGKLCPAAPGGSGGGNADNMGWFAFVAGSDSLSITITPFNCIPQQNNEIGIQAGIFTDCTFETSVVCDAFTSNGGAGTPIQLNSGDFIPGQVYYFWVDGYSGAICNFTVTVNFGVQPFALPPIDTIQVTNDANVTNTVCLGYQGLAMDLADFDIDIDYTWSISPANPDYPAGINSSKTANSIWNFNHAGTYEICVQATNFCDVTSPKCRTFEVASIEDEVFDPISVCENEFPLAGPLDEDPNGDGVVGWFGPIITSAGLKTYNVTLSNGCSYTQEVLVSTIPLGARTPVTITSCGPVTYFGVEYTASVTDLPLNIENGSMLTGCDSLVMLSVVIIDIAGDVVIGACENGGVTIELQNFQINTTEDYEVAYRWLDQMGNELSTVGPRFLALSNGNYTLEVSVTLADGATCTKVFDSVNLNLEDLKPATPVESAWQVTLCEGSGPVTFSVQDDPTVDNYNWTANNGATIQTIGSKNSIEIRFPGVGDYEVCVQAVNACGTSAIYCQTINILQVPQVDFNLLPTSCLGTSISAQFININSNPNFSYSWTIDGGTLLSGSLTAGSDLTFSFDTPGTKTVTLQGFNQICASQIRSKTIEVQAPDSIQNLSCTTTANSITFAWNDLACANSYSIDAGPLGVFSSNSPSITFDGLGQGTEVSVVVDSEDACICGVISQSLSCETIICEGITVQINGNPGIICESEWNNPIQLGTTISGSHNGSLRWDGDVNISPSGLFIPSQMGEGTYKIKAVLSYLGCEYVDETTITLVKQPVLDLTTLDPKCLEDLFGSVIVNVVGNNNYTYTIDGVPQNGNSNDVSIGNHVIEVVDGNACKVVNTFVINPPVVPDYEISGDPEVYESQEVRYNLSLTNPEAMQLDSIAWYINGELICVGKNCNSVNFGLLEPGDYRHRVVLYYNDCFIVEEFDTRVKVGIRLIFPNIVSFGGSTSNAQNSRWTFATNTPEVVVEEFAIFDRWGNKMYSKSNFQPAVDPVDWDGSFGGRFIQAGVYVYVATYQDEFGKMVKVSGDITVIR